MRVLGVLVVLVLAIVLLTLPICHGLDNGLAYTPVQGYVS